LSENIVPHKFQITRDDRSKKLNQKPCLIWYTGLSGSGKSTLANAVERSLFDKGFLTYSLDGDNVRHGISNNLDFSAKDRSENIRRIGEVAKLMIDAGLIVSASFVSPFEKDRELVKDLIGKANFIEIYVSTPLSECERRDVKGLYKKARNGEITDFTGISSPFEEPKSPDLSIDTTNISIADASKIVLSIILKKIAK